MNAEDRDGHTVELEELVVRPGTYFNPQTEVVVVVDDSTSIDQEVFESEGYEGAEWVQITEEVPIDADGLAEVIERFHTSHHPGLGDTVAEGALETSEDDQPDPALDHHDHDEEPETPVDSEEA